MYGDVGVVGSAIQLFFLSLFLYASYKFLRFALEYFGNFMAIADTAVKEFDKNGDGVISKDEFEMFKIKYFYDSEKWQKWLDKKFTKFDLDKDGSLNTSEFKSLINRMLRRLEAQDGLGTPVEKTREQLLGKTVDSLLFDRYGDIVLGRLVEGTADYKLSNLK